MHIFGLTGGLASGKSTVTTLFHRQGAKVLDADQLVRWMLDTDIVLQRQIADLFGPDVLCSPTSPWIDRAALARHVFADAGKRRQLESVVHPALEHRSKGIFSIWEQEGASWCLYDAALLVETERYKQLDGLIVVDIPEDMQLRRACDRGMSTEDAQRRIAAQASRQERLDAADWIIDNSGDIEHTTHQVEKLYNILCQHGSEGASPTTR